ncbi:MAG: TRC40/GET3/ArsA family transport-energizing ATPase [Thermodesulforhabdaceae bacterium]
MRVLMFVGKGGVGKTSMAAATALRAARLGYRTLILSLDIAHNLSDIFDLDRSLFDMADGKPVKVTDNLYIQELDMHRELQRNWKEVHDYLSLLLNTAGFHDVLAEELAILPGMEEVSALLWMNAYVKNKSFDAVILDCAPTGESLRFISIPTALEWYIKKIFKLERSIARIVRPIVKHVSDVPMPEESYFNGVERLFSKLHGSAEILTDPQITSVRLVTNPEKIVLKETLRAFMYFALYKVNVDAIILNRLIPPSVTDSYFTHWKEIHARYAAKAKEYFDPIPILTVDLFDGEIVGIRSLESLGEVLYGDRNPLSVFYYGIPFEFSKDGDYTVVRINIPFANKNDVEVYRVGDELVVRLGACRRNIPLPRSSLGAGGEIRARFNNGRLEVLIGGQKNGATGREEGFM